MKTTLTGTSRHLLLGLTGLLCFFFASPSVRADEGDPPSRVARISLVDGSVSFQPGGTGDWGSAARNRTVTIGDKIWADKDSRAELQAGQAAIHIGSMTALSFLNLDENITQMRLAEGALNFRVRELREGDLYEVDTPNLAFTVKQAGNFRIDVSENGDSTRVIVVRGDGEVTASGKTYAVHAGEAAEFSGTDNVAYSVSQAPEPDGLDRWSNERDLKEDNSTSAQYVSRDVPGYSDLDDNGTWSEQPEEGPVWYPNEVPVGWAPYSYGYWNWVGPWGWTWIDYAPWGFAPFHYGRWGFFGNRWGWCPGPIFARPFFGPAFVGFLGGPRFGIGFGFGGGFGVGWFPLGFHEPFFPGFRASRGFINNINIRNTTIRNVNVLNANHFNNYAFAHNVNAVTAASRSAFVSGQAINRGAAHITEASLRGAEVSNHTSFTPTRQSAMGAANLSGHVSTPPSSIQNRSVMARTAPAAGASHMPVHTMNTTGLSAARTAGNSSASNARVNQLSQNRPPSANAGLSNRATLNGANNANGVSQNRSTTGGRTWEAQGNTTDRGNAPQGFGHNTPAVNGNNQATRSHLADRPPWAGTGSTGSANTSGGRLSSPSNTNRPTYSNGSRSYEPPSRTYSPSSRTYSSPRSSYPSSSPRSYSAPSRTYSAPSHPSGAGGSSPHGGGGGSPHGGGGSPHGGGGASHTGHR
jgi:uncharacterized membrane protein YgcG